MSPRFPGPASPKRFGGWRHAFTAMLAASAPSAAVAVTSAGSYTQVSQNFPVGSPTYQSATIFDPGPGPGNQQVGPSGTSLVLNSSGPSGHASASSIAMAADGRLSVLATTNSGVRSGRINLLGDLDGSDAVSARVETIAEWKDGLTITAPGRAGAGSLIARLSLSGAATSNASSGAVSIRNADGSSLTLANRGFAGLEIAGTGLDPYSQTWDDACAAKGLAGRIACAMTDNLSADGETYALGGVVDLNVVIPFTFGRETSIRYWARATSGADASTYYYRIDGATSVVSIADMAHTLAWGGILAVRDGVDRDVDDFAVASVSGFDYRHPYAIPEPATWALLLAGLGAIGWQARRRGGR